MPDDYSVTMQLSGYEVLCINALLNSVSMKRIKKRVPKDVIDVFTKLTNRFSVEVKNYNEFLSL